MARRISVPHNGMLTYKAENIRAAQKAALTMSAEAAAALSALNQALALLEAGTEDVAALDYLSDTALDQSVNARISGGEVARYMHDALLAKEI